MKLKGMNASFQPTYQYFIFSHIVTLVSHLLKQVWYMYCYNYTKFS